MMPKRGNPEIKIYGNTAKKVEGSKIVINGVYNNNQIFILLPITKIIKKNKEI
jgi:hypothetical protein